MVILKVYECVCIFDLQVKKKKAISNTRNRCDFLIASKLSFVFRVSVGRDTSVIELQVKTNYLRMARCDF